MPNIGQEAHASLKDGNKVQQMLWLMYWSDHDTKFSKGMSELLQWQSVCFACDLDIMNAEERKCVQAAASL